MSAANDTGLFDSIFRVSQGLLVLRVIEGLKVDQVIQASMDQRVKKVTRDPLASLVQKEAWYCVVLISNSQIRRCPFM